MTLRALTATSVAALIIAAASCGGSPSSPSAPPGNTPPVQTTTVTITSTGVSPKNIEVTAGSRVLFINNDTRSHNMTSNPHPDHTDCPELNQVGLLSPGQQRETGNLVTPRTCGYHDHDNPSASGLFGQVVIR